MDKEIDDIINNNNTIQDPILAEKIESKIRKHNKITVPSIVLEYITSDNTSFEMEDFKKFFSNFGEVLNILIKEQKSIVLFKTFFIANLCKEFLEKEENYKNNMKQKFKVRFFNYDTDFDLLMTEVKPLFKDIHSKNIKSNINENNSGINQNNNKNLIKMNMNMNINNINITTGMTSQQNPKMFYMVKMQNMNNPKGPNVIFPNYNNFNMFNPYQRQQVLNMLMNQNIVNNINNMANRNFMNNPNMENNNHNNQDNNNSCSNNSVNDEKNLSKYTCKYQILIPNDKNFQIAKRLIGSKGSNMKKIIDECKSIWKEEGIKLRLRGKGSGYKEGSENKESEEPLHLCISTKNPDEMKKACLLVDELLNKIHEEYKEYCEKNNVEPISTNIAARIDNKNWIKK